MATVGKFPTGNGTQVTGAWTNPNSLNANDGSHSQFTTTTKNDARVLRSGAVTFTDSDIPVGAVINSVSLEVEHQVTSGGTLRQRLRLGTTNGADQDASPTSLTVNTFSDLTRPGGGSWTESDLKGGTLTVEVEGRQPNNTTSRTYQWDYVRVVVDYTVVTTPTVTTGAVSAVEQTTATVAGQVVSDGGATVTERGFVAKPFYPTGSQPTIADSKFPAAAGGVGLFSVDATGLIPARLYSIRAYATNAAGTSYGAVSSIHMKLPTRAVDAQLATPASVVSGDTGTHPYSSYPSGTIPEALSTRPTDFDDFVTSHLVSINVNSGYSKVNVKLGSLLTPSNPESPHILRIIVCNPVDGDIWLRNGSDDSLIAIRGLWWTPGNGSYGSAWTRLHNTDYEYGWFLEPSEVAEILDYNDLIIEIQQNEDGGDTVTQAIGFVELEVPWAPEPIDPPILILPEDNATVDPTEILTFEWEHQGDAQNAYALKRVSSGDFEEWWDENSEIWQTFEVWNVIGNEFAVFALESWEPVDTYTWTVRTSESSSGVESEYADPFTVIVSTDSGTTYNRTGSLVAAAVAVGADALEYVEVGSIIADTLLAGVDVPEYIEAGSLTATGRTSAVSMFEDSVTGSLIATGRLAGQSAKEIAGKAGAIRATGRLVGIDASERSELGSLIASGVLRGTKSAERIKTGSLIADTLLIAVDVAEYSELGSLVADTLLAGVGSKEAPGKSGALMSAAKILGIDAAEYAETGSLRTTARIAGLDVAEYGELGALIATARLAGITAAEGSKLGSLVSTGLLRGVDASERSELGALVADTLLAGVDAPEYVERGSLVSSGRIVGIDAAERTETGVLIADTLLVGLSVKEAPGKSGALLAGTDVLGIYLLEYAKSGVLITDTLLIGVDEHVASAISDKSGVLVAATNIRGADEFIASRTGSLTTITSLLGASSPEFGKSGSLVATAQLIHDIVSFVSDRGRAVALIFRRNKAQGTIKRRRNGH